jgi:hypothetical protein
LRATVGPQGVTYYERFDGLTLAYRPRGILLPPRCPRHGFPFSARFSFLDKSETSAATAIACPDPKQRHRKPPIGSARRPIGARGGVLNRRGGTYRARMVQ